MKAIRKGKMSSTEFSRMTEKRFNYTKFIKSTLKERRKQKNLHK